MVDVVLIHPNGVHGIYGPLGDELVSREQPLWPRLIAGYLIDHGASVAIIDAECEGLSPGLVASLVAGYSPRLAVIVVSGHQPSASTQAMPGAREVAEAINDERLLGTSIVMMGNHPSALPVQTLAEEPVDYVIDGEGPLTIMGLLNGDHVANIPGLVWTEKPLFGDERIVQNPLAPLLDVDRDLHGNAWHLLPDASKYRSHNWQRFGDLSKRSPYAAIYTSLGCAFKCHFCLREGTLIVTKKGSNKKIEKLKVGDELLSWDEAAQKISETTITKTASRTVNGLLKITVQSGEVIEVTKEHPLLTERGWIAAGEIRPADRILVMDRKDKVKYLKSTYNPMSDPKIAAQVGATMKKRHGKRAAKDMAERWATGKIVPHKMSNEGRQASSKRMKFNNPMKRPEVAAKVSATRKALIDSGQFVPFMCTTEGKKVISKIARERALTNNPMHDPTIAQSPKSKANRTAYMLRRWADPVQAAQLMAVKKYGEDHPNWKGGLSNEPYPLAFRASFKRKIYERDGGICQSCGDTHRLAVHHIDYIKENLDECNLISLCVSCNAKANFDRPYWYTKYSSMMLARGQCPHFETITSIEKLEGEFKVYNFECSPHNNYWAGFILSHNCMINVFQHTNKYRMRSPKAVVNEMIMLYEQGVRTFKFVDELFVLNKKHCHAICDLLANTIGAEINIWCYARTDTVDPSDLKMFRAAGFQWFALGIESGSETVRDGADKHLSSYEIKTIVHKIEAAGIHVIANYIFGLPGETPETMDETVALAQELNTSWANFYSAMAYPGSKLYDEAIEKGWTLPATWAGYSQHNEYTLPLAAGTVSAREILAARDRAFDRYFTNPRYLDSVTQRFGQEARAHVEEMTSYKLKRNLLEEV